MKHSPWGRSFPRRAGRNGSTSSRACLTDPASQAFPGRRPSGRWPPRSRTECGSSPCTPRRTRGLIPRGLIPRDLVPAGPASRRSLAAAGRTARASPARESPAGTSGSSTPTLTRRRTNEAVLADLENGVTSLWLAVGGPGLPVAALPDVLERRLPGPGARRPRRGRRLRRGRRAVARGSTPRADGDHGGRRDGQPRRRPARACSPAPAQGADTARQLGRGRASRRTLRRGVPGPARPDRRRAALPRGRRLHGAGAGLLAGHGGRLPAGADRRRADRRRGGRAAGVPLRGHRRPVPDHRQAAGRAPAVVPGRRGLRLGAGGARRSASTR